MTSPNPDLPAAVDLTLHDVSERDLVQAAVDAIRVRIPDWVPQEGHVEVLLIEAAALLIGQYSYGLNEIPRKVLDGVIQLDGVSRLPAIAAGGTVQVTIASTTSGIKLLPWGSRFRVALGDGTSIDLISDEQVQINPANGLTATVHVTAEYPGAAANGVPAGTAVQTVDVVQWVESAQLASALAGGADAESDAVFYARAAAIRRRRTDTLVTAENFETAALDVPGVGRAKGFSLWDGTGAPGTDLGHVTVVVAAPDGTEVTGQVAAAVQSTLSGKSVAGLQIHVIDPDFQPFGIGVQITLAPGYTEAAVAAAVQADLQAWLAPAARPWGQRLWENEVVVRVGQVPGVARVVDITGPAIAITAPSPIMLPQSPIPVTVTVVP
ncbi:baseplate J/gp47 family protein [Nakamurella leprariae]|uniref:Baseplate J/gp47 family protein n=1 Tax=Nakamurella leprariae TaxID=2803911 RepID=A0A938Y751_9ACTN|nr:baseplate J/gp47 family protein [Nakamurella leprariae]MBM9467266.1 baseplate J/gp47 family protein [Nakamurella leprariae]